jgi:hypothetical protein
MAQPYQRLGNGVIYRVADGAFIQPTDANPDYREYQAWAAAAGNTPDPYPAPAKAASVDPVTFLSRLTAAQQTTLLNSWLTTLGATAAQKTTLTTP